MISSTQNNQVKNLIKLRKARERKRQEIIIIEGSQEIKTAIQAGIEIIKLYYAEFFTQEKIIDIDKTLIEEVSKDVFAKVSYRQNPDGFLALAKPKHLELSQIKLKKSSLIVVLESVEKPGNLGAILRTADAVQTDAVIVCDRQTDIYNPNVIRSSLGTVFTNQVATDSSEETVKLLKSKKIALFASSPEASTLYTDVNYRPASAIIIGTEHDGLSKIWLDQAEERIRIPMHGRIDSLNASVSTAVVLYEAIRQRN